MMDWMWIGWKISGSLMDGCLLDGYPSIGNAAWGLVGKRLAVQELDGPRVSQL